MIVVPGPLSDGESEMEYLIVAWKVLNYFPPNPTMLENMRPTKDMNGFLQEHMEFDHMIDKVVMAWEIISERDS